MTNILMGINTKNKFEAFAKNLPQALIVVGSNGMGKETILKKLAEHVCGTKWRHSTNILRPLDDKKQISIDQIREIKASLKLSTNTKRIVIIPNAEKLTTEAQNSLLKMLEEPPALTHFLLGVSKLSSLLVTIQSRSAVWLLVKPSNAEILEYYPGVDKEKIDKAILVSERKPGTLHSHINDEAGSELFASIDNAREVLGSSEFDRMCMVNSISKDPKSLVNLLDALEIICQSALHNVIGKGDQKSMKAWQKRLKYVEQAITQLEKNIQPKLVISKLLLML
ncbi:hypothetical protein KA025_00205 [Candidatus Saccharibacteria bacterium]|jgi:hypothetical protein|nr:hypothetical protein [Candidatus Saccharibacteria bacterium]MBP7834494.1 hypothetical protein [Candidatus Saccharibacteria bacterium]